MTCRYSEVGKPEDDMDHPDTLNWTGVLLAGGRSTRMGRDKARLDWQGRPLLDHMRSLLQAAGAAHLVVSGSQALAAEAIPDRIADFGPLGGLASVAAALPDGVLLLVPVDMPLLGPELLSALVATPADCVAWEGHVLPLRLRLDARVREWLRTIPERARRERSLRALHAAMQGIWLPLAPGMAGKLVNCNTPGEWQAVSTELI